MSIKGAALIRTCTGCIESKNFRKNKDTMFNWKRTFPLGIVALNVLLNDDYWANLVWAFIISLCLYGDRNFMENINKYY